jgi:hypothetical protein
MDPAIAPVTAGAAAALVFCNAAAASLTIGVAPDETTHDADFARIPMRRWAEIEVAEAAVFLSSASAAYITGAIIDVQLGTPDAIPSTKDWPERVGSCRRRYQRFQCTNCSTGARLTGPNRPNG